MNYFEFFVKGFSRRNFLSVSGAAVAGSVLLKRNNNEKIAGAETVVEELPDEIFLHGAGMFIPH